MSHPARNVILKTMAYIIKVFLKLQKQQLKHNKYIKILKQIVMIVIHIKVFFILISGSMVLGVLFLSPKTLLALRYYPQHKIWYSNKNIAIYI